MNRISSLYIAETQEMGRGVFTSSFIPKGSVIELCPVLIIPAEDVPQIHATCLHDYYFLWGDQGEAALALGFGSLYNHATDHNADYTMDYQKDTIDIFSIRAIQAGEEITINYFEGGEEYTERWFEEK